MSAPSVEMIAAMERAYAEATGINWSKLHVNHRAGLIAVFAAIDRSRQPQEWRPGTGGRHPHFCVSCSDGVTAGPGCINCCQTGHDQTPWPSCQGCGR